MTKKPTYEELKQRVKKLEQLELERKTEDEILQIFSMSLYMICIADISTATFIKVNTAFEDILGHSEEALLDKPFLDFVHPDDIAATRAVIEQKLKSGDKVINFENRYRCKDGSYRWLSWVSHPIIEQGVTYAIARDITERKQNEEKLKKSKALLDATGRMAKVGGWEMDAKTLAVNWTEATYHIHEVPLDYKPPLEEAINFFHPEDREQLKQAIQNALENGEPYDMEIRFITAKGKHLWTRTICQPEMVHGKTARLKGTFQDITKRKTAEEALKKSEERFRNLYDDAPVGYFEYDLQGNITRVNRTELQMLGYTAEEMIGQPCWKFIVEEVAQEQILAKLRGVRPPAVGLERTYRRKDGTTFPVLFEDRLMLDEDGRITGIRTAIQDITERKQAEAAREELQEQLSQAQKMESIGSLSGGIAHDFNNLLFPIVGLSEMMLDDFPPDSMEHQNIQEIFQAGTRGRELVQQILSFSRQSAHQPIKVHIQKILKEVLKLCRATIPADISITPKIVHECGPVKADPTKIHQIAMNLITNAYHALEPTGGTITVQLKEIDFNPMDDPAVQLASGRYAVLSVSDTGTGIDPAVLDKIFDPYFTTKKKGRGTGLGLSTVYGIVKAHEGDIRVHSEMGKGTSFHVYLPLLEKTQASEPENEIPPLPTGTEHILLVDDEAPIVHLQKQMLDRLGYRITSFTSSMAALAAFKTDPSRFDLVITDMNMPGTNGMQLAEKMTAIRSDIPVIICTGFSERINREKADAIGINGLLMKPFAKSEMAQMVRNLLDQTTDSAQT